MPCTFGRIGFRSAGGRCTGLRQNWTAKAFGDTCLHYCEPIMSRKITKPGFCPGKGDAPRPGNRKAYADNYDCIFRRGTPPAGDSVDHTAQPVVHKTCPTWGLTECGKDLYFAFDGGEPCLRTTLRWPRVTCPDCIATRSKRRA